MILESFVIAFAMYSKIPMPKVTWNEKNMRYAMCFFPLIGAVIGSVMYLVMYLCNQFNIGNVLFAVLMTIIPIIITGGIHMDGFLDTVDAVSSYGDKEKRLAILKDPHAGAFAIIFGIVYMLLNFGLWTEIGYNGQAVLFIACGYVLSRTLSGLSVVTFKMAKDTGLAKTFADGSKKKVVRTVLLIMLAMEMAAMLYMDPKLGGIVIGASLLTFVYYYFFSKRVFGGITGDLCGYFLQLCELMIIIGTGVGSMS